jgi:hypothetical protein
VEFAEGFAAGYATSLVVTIAGLVLAAALERRRRRKLR